MKIIKIINALVSRTKGGGKKLPRKIKSMQNAKPEDIYTQTAKQLGMVPT